MVVSAARRVPGQAFGPLTDLSPAQFVSDAYGAKAAVADGGRALVTWAAGVDPSAPAPAGVFAAVADPMGAFGGPQLLAGAQTATLPQPTAAAITAAFGPGGLGGAARRTDSAHGRAVRSGDSVAAMPTPERAVGRGPRCGAPGASRPLRGRGRECEAIDRLIDGVRAGRSVALVVCGEAGMGKTALLEYAIQRASGFRVARAAGVQAETELRSPGCISCARRCSTGSSGSRFPRSTR